MVKTGVYLENLVFWYFFSENSPNFGYFIPNFLFLIGNIGWNLWNLDQIRPRIVQNCSKIVKIVKI